MSDIQSEEYVYGTEPNQFFKEQLQKIIPAGKLLLPGEGEGRNAVYAAKLGWMVDAFDQSSVARTKALNLAKEKKSKLITLILISKNLFRKKIIMIVLL